MMGRRVLAAQYMGMNFDTIGLIRNERSAFVKLVDFFLHFSTGRQKVPASDKPDHASIRKHWKFHLNHLI
jgi:hypothetical protein